MAWSKLVSTEMEQDQITDMMMPIMPGRTGPDFPCGMQISLDEWLLERLGLDQDVEVGDYLDMRCFATVTSIIKSQGNGDAKCHVCLTIEKIAIEDEMGESTGLDDEED